MINLETSEKILKVKNVILYDQKSGAVVKKLSSHDIESLETEYLNNIYNEMQVYSFKVESIIILEAKRKLKENLKEKLAYYIINERDYWGVWVDLYINENYFTNYTEQPAAKKTEMRTGYFYIYDSIKLQFKNMCFKLQTYQHYFCKGSDAATGRERELTLIDEEIKRAEENEKLFLKRGSRSRFIQALKERKQAGFEYMYFSYSYAVFKGEACTLENYVYSHSETSDQYKKAETYAKKIKDRLYKELDPSTVLELVEILKDF